jgi:choline dehydrogenase-like flavoprotein
MARGHKEFMHNYPNFAVHIVLARDRTPNVRIGVRDNGQPAVDYYLSDVEKNTFRHGLKNLAKLNFEAGAKYIYTGHSVPTKLKSPKDISKIDELSFGENEHMLFTAHQMATCPMGEDKKITVVNSEGESHEIKNLFMFDGSVFPNAPGVNPMLSIMGFSTHLSNHLISNRVKYFS